MIKNKAKENMKNSMIGAVPHPGDTFPYSEFKGFKISPKRVLRAIKLFISLQNNEKRFILITLSILYN